MRRTNNLVGNRYGYLTVVSKALNERGAGTMWHCVCDCGNKTTVRSDSLVTGRTTSCGCRGHKYRPSEHKRLYRVWTNMISKCSNPRHRNYRHYGAVGISVCNEWRWFDNFAEWMFSNGYDETLPRGEQTIDRINCAGNYNPDNCRLISIKEQQRNKRSCVNLAYHGRTVCATELSELLGVDYELVRILAANGYTAAQIESVVNMKRDAS